MSPATGRARPACGTPWPPLRWKSGSRPGSSRWRCCPAHRPAPAAARSGSSHPRRRQLINPAAAPPTTSNNASHHSTPRSCQVAPAPAQPPVPNRVMHPPPPRLLLASSSPPPRSRPRSRIRTNRMRNHRVVPHPTRSVSRNDAAARPGLPPEQIGSGTTGWFRIRRDQFQGRAAQRAAMSISWLTVSSSR